MKTVKIIKGAYGYKPEGSKIVKPVPRGETIELPDNEADRLVSIKVAEYVSEEKPIGFDEVPPAEDSSLPNLPDGVTVIPEYSVKSSVADLRAIAKACGITFKVGMTKEEMVAALDAHIAENTIDDGEDDGENGGEPDSESDLDPNGKSSTDEEAPTFNAADAVVQ